MKRIALRPPTVITHQPQLSAMLERLMVAPAVAVDTESDSLYVYHEKVCLIQFSVPAQDYLVDPLSGIDLSPLAGLFAEPRIEKVFHAAEYDLLCLRRDFGFEFNSLFDTMWAARILGWKQVSLASILQEHFGVRLDKRWQRHNWGRRPLDGAAVAYARLDTHYLLAVRDMQLAQLRAADREEEAIEIFEQVCHVTPMPRAFDPQSFWRVKGVWDLTGREQAIVRELHAYRDQQARQHNRPPFRVLSDQTLIALARRRPRSLQALHAMQEVTPLQINRYGRGILEAIARGCQAEIPRPICAPRPDESLLQRYKALRAWRNALARQRGVEPDVIMSNATLMEIAHRRPTTPADLEGIEGLGPWRRKAYGEQVLRMVSET